MRGVNNLAFPNIQTNVPVGTQMVSTIDDFERETRSWLKQCMQQISGYPDLDTITVKGWTNSTRPSANPSTNYLVGYNTQTKALEVIDSNGQVQDIQRTVLLAAHPVGEYYWTSNTSFNPNTAWGGTWERIQDGRVLISNNSSHAVGSTGGAETVTLALTQIPPHQHPHTHKHKHARGTMEITGKFGSEAQPSGYTGTSPISGAFYLTDNSSRAHISSNVGGINQDYNFQASRSWSGYTTEDATGASSHAQGGGQAHNNMQPYRTAICWHRTA